MSKKKLKMSAVAVAVAVTLALVPLLHGCAAGDQRQAAEQAPPEQQDADSAPEAVRYGQVVAIDGDEVSVSLGSLEDAKDGSGTKAFQAGEGETTFKGDDVTVTNDSGAIVEFSELSTHDILAMQGRGEGAGFKPQDVEILSTDSSGTVAGDVSVPQGA